MSKLVRKRQVVAKIEAIEGTAETLSASDAGFLVDFMPKVNFDPQMYTRDPVRASFTKLGKLTGKRAAGFDFGMKLRGSGLVTAQPKFAPLIRACGFEVNALKQITIGAVTSGPFEHGETITGGTSGATGRVVIETADGTTILYFVSLSGSFQDAETITGGTSGASATSAAAPTDAGHEIKPVSNNFASLTMASYEDGVRKLLRGCRGSVKFSFPIGEPAGMEFAFMGVEAGVIDTALLSGIDYGDTVEPVVLNGQMSVDGVSLNIGTLEIDMAVVLASRDKIDDEKGILSYMITDRNPTGSMNPEMLPVATHDFYTKWFNNEKMALDFSYGSTAGNRFRFYAPQVQYTKIDDADRDGLQLAQCSFDLTGTLTPGDDEITILCL